MHSWKFLPSDHPQRKIGEVWKYLEKNFNYVEKKAYCIELWGFEPHFADLVLFYFLTLFINFRAYLHNWLFKASSRIGSRQSEYVFLFFQEARRWTGKRRVIWPIVLNSCKIDSLSNAEPKKTNQGVNAIGISLTIINQQKLRTCTSLRS